MTAWASNAVVNLFDLDRVYNPFLNMKRNFAERIEVHLSTSSSHVFFLPTEYILGFRRDQDTRPWLIIAYTND